MICFHSKIAPPPPPTTTNTKSVAGCKLVYPGGRAMFLLKELSKFRLFAIVRKGNHVQ